MIILYEVKWMIIERSSTWQEGFIERLEARKEWDSWTLYKTSYDIVSENLITDLKDFNVQNIYRR